MELARVSGQPFSDMLTWHPRDVDTLEEIYLDEASEARMDAARRRLKQQMG